MGTQTPWVELQHLLKCCQLQKQADDEKHMNTIYVQIWKVGDEIRAEYTTPE